MSLLFQLQFTSSSFFWLLGCLALGIGYAFLLYGQTRNLSKPFRQILFALRAIMVTLLAFLLFAPLIKSISQTLEKPLIILAQDNSQSVDISKAQNFNASAYADEFRKLEKTLGKEYEVRAFSFGQEVKEGFQFTHNQKLTNISAVFKTINDRFANRNIGAVILASDGIYNRGGNPQFDTKSLKAPVYTVALGDTIPKKDVLISNINYNNIAYLGNQFQIEVTAEAFQSAGASTRLTVRHSSGVLSSKAIAVSGNEFRQTISLTLPAKAKGIQKFIISLAPVPGELSTQNNTQTIYVEVMDGRENVLIIANAPHPDVTALKQSIETNQNYEVKSAIIDAVDPADIAKAGILILHQVPSVSNSAATVLRQIATKPTLFILGAQTNSEAFSLAQPLLGISSANTTQEVLPHIKSDFYTFTLSENAISRLSNLGPLLAPVGNYALKSAASVLLTQQIGRVATETPLLVFGDAGQRKIAILAGEGLWRWRLENFQEAGNHEAVDELIGKSIQYLSSKDDKRKFRVYATKNTFDENESVILNAELYNDAYELVNAPDVKIDLKHQSGKLYSYVFSRTGNSYLLDAGVLPAGEYSYQASTQLGANKHSAGGRFIITQQQVELQQTTANHQLLFALAQQTAGKMIFPEQLNQLPELIKANENIKTIAYENKRYDELIDLKWVFFLLLGLISAEWFIRKRNGEI